MTARGESQIPTDSFNKRANLPSHRTQFVKFRPRVELIGQVKVKKIERLTGFFRGVLHRTIGEGTLFTQSWPPPQYFFPALHYITMSSNCGNSSHCFHYSNFLLSVRFKAFHALLLVIFEGCPVLYESVKAALFWANLLV